MGIHFVKKGPPLFDDLLWGSVVQPIALHLECATALAIGAEVNHYANVILSVEEALTAAEVTVVRWSGLVSDLAMFDMLYSF
jgi:hypothetical protein